LERARSVCCRSLQDDSSVVYALAALGLWPVLDAVSPRVD
jgi:hypothetical protein